MFQIIWIHIFNNMQNLGNSLGNPTTSGRNPVASLLEKTISYTGNCEYELRSSMNHVWIDPKKGWSQKVDRSKQRKTKSKHYIL